MRLNFWSFKLITKDNEYVISRYVYYVYYLIQTKGLIVYNSVMGLFH